MSRIRVHNIILPHKPLSNVDLEKAAKELAISHFRGVFMRNNLPKKPRGIECGILNHDSLSGPGTHWTCWFRKHSQRVYFDPYGLPPPNELRRYLGFPIHYNTDELQQRGSVVCGHICLHVLKELSGGRPFDEAVFSLTPVNK